MKLYQFRLHVNFTGTVIVNLWSYNNTLLAEGWISSTKEALDIAIKLRKLPQKDKGYWQFESKAWKSVKVK